MASITINVAADVDRAVAAVDQVNKHLGDLDAQSGQAGQGLKGLGTELEGVGQSFPALGGLAVAAGSAIGGALGAIAGEAAAAAGKLAAAFALATSGVTEFKALVVPAFTEVNEAVSKAAAGQANAYAGLTPAQAAAAKATLALRDAVDQQSKAFAQPVLEAYTKGVQTLQGLLPNLVQLATPARDALVGIFTKLNDAAKSPEFAQFLGQLTQQAGTLMPVLGQIVSASLDLGKALAPLIPPLLQITQAVLPLIPPLVELTAILVKFQATALVPLIAGLGELAQFLVGQQVQALDAAVQGFDKLGQGVAKLGPVVVSGFQSMGATISDYVSRLPTIGQAWDTLKNSVSNAIRSLVDISGTIKRQIVQQFSDAGDWLKDAGKNIIQGLLKGIQDSSPLVKAALGGLTASIPQWKGPPSTDATLLVDAGLLIMQGLVDGLDQGETGVMRQLAGTSQRIASAFDGTGPTISTSLSGFGSDASLSGAAGGRVLQTVYLNVQVSPTADRVAIGREIGEALSEARRAGWREN